MRHDAHVDKATYVLYSAVAEVARELDILWMVTGAASRVVLLESAYRLPRGKATEDVDFAIMVESWGHYQAIEDQICRDPAIARDSKQRQRFRHSDGAYFDLIPFGGVETADHVIEWPPENDIVMSVLGFRDVCNDVVRITLNNKLEVPVVSPVGLVLLKLIAWRDRHETNPRRDAADIAYVLRYFSTIETEEKLFDHHYDAMEAADFDLDLASARVLGRRTRSLASAEAHRQLVVLLDDELDMGEDSDLVREIAGSLPVTGIEQVYQLMDLFRTGLQDGVDP